MGGTIRGTVVANKCSVEQAFGSEQEYEVCLNAEYGGENVTECTVSSESLLESKDIVVRGGAAQSHSHVFEEFRDKEADFEEWADSLLSDPSVVGGDVYSIHDVVEDAVLMGNHSLNLGVSTPMDDDEWLRIAEAMERAFDDHSAQIDALSSFDVAECDIECHGGTLDHTDCVCECESVAECCGLTVDAVDALEVCEEIDDLVLMAMAIAIGSSMITCCGLSLKKDWEHRKGTASSSLNKGHELKLQNMCFQNEPGIPNREPPIKGHWECQMTSTMNEQRPLRSSRMRKMKLMSCRPMHCSVNWKRRMATTLQSQSLRSSSLHSALRMPSSESESSDYRITFSVN